MTIKIISTPDLVSISRTVEGRPFNAGCAEASMMDRKTGEWFVNRVFVRKEFRRGGIGREMVASLLSEVTKQGCKKLVLTPGGYDIPYEDQEAFYLKCGFRLIKHGLMEYP